MKERYTYTKRLLSGEIKKMRLALSYSEKWKGMPKARIDLETRLKEFESVFTIIESLER